MVTACAVGRNADRRSPVGARDHASVSLAQFVILGLSPKANNGANMQDFPRLRQRRFKLQQTVMGMQEMLERVEQDPNPDLDRYRLWQMQGEEARQELSEIEYLLKTADRLVSNGNGVWKSRYIWIFITFSLFQVVPLLLYLLR